LVDRKGYFAGNLGGIYLPLYYDSTIWILIPGILISMLAQMKVQGTFNTYSKIKSQKGITGSIVARTLLDSNGLSYVKVEKIQQNLGDHYDPRENVIRLSPEVYDSSSISALGVCAHECGHAMQFKEGYAPVRVRDSILPVVSFSSNLAFPLILFGLFFNMLNLIYMGIIAFSAVLLFQLVTLPVEFNASRRAIVALENEGYLNHEEIAGAKKVLSAAAMTYVAATLLSLLTLIRFISIGNSRRR